jgi:transposase
MGGHVHVFRTFGGVLAGKIRYDNLKAAVASVFGPRSQNIAVNVL